jgi:hypothetical protein
MADWKTFKRSPPPASANPSPRSLSRPHQIPTHRWIPTIAITSSYVEVFALCRKTNKKWPCCHFIAKSENWGKNQVNSRASGEAQVNSACTASSSFSPSFNGRLFSPFLLLPHQLQRVPRATEQAAASSSSLLARVSGCLSV